MSIERQARVCNGAIVFLAGLLTMFWDPRVVWVVIFMGASLILSGVTDFCGFAVILRRWQQRKGKSLGAHDAAAGRRGQSCSL